MFAYWITRNYRESYGMFACNGIMFNHESERRGETFVTRKITRGLARIKLGKQDKLYLGNLDAMRDWGYAKDYVVATNESHSVREFVEEAARRLEIAVAWKGSGLKERGIDRKSGKTIIEIDPQYFRPAEVDALRGDYSKARRKLGWKPRVTFHELVGLMVRADYDKERAA